MKFKYRMCQECFGLLIIYLPVAPLSKYIQSLGGKPKDKWWHQPCFDRMAMRNDWYWGRTQIHVG